MRGGDQRIREWLSRLKQAGDDLRLARSIADEIQRSVQPGDLHEAATCCRLACAYAARNRGSRHQVESQIAIGTLRSALELSVWESEQPLRQARLHASG